MVTTKAVYLALLAKPQVEKWEGRRAKVYRDTKGHPTVGIGHNLDRTDSSSVLAELGLDHNLVKAGRTKLSEQQIDALFVSDFAACVEAANRLIWSFHELPDTAQIIISDMIFNMGSSTFSKFRKTRSAFTDRKYSQAADEMLNSTWGRTSHRAKPYAAAIRALDETCSAHTRETRNNGTTR